MSFDLANLNVAEKSEEGTWIEIEHPVSSEPLGMHVKILGTESKAYQKALRKNQDKRLKKGMRKVKSEELENESIELLVQCVVDWQDFVFEGEELECKPENIRWVFKNYKWVKDQVDEQIGDYSNFLAE